MADEAEYVVKTGERCEPHDQPLTSTVPTAPTDEGISVAWFRCPKGCRFLRAYALDGEVDADEELTDRDLELMEVALESSVRACRGLDVLQDEYRHALAWVMRQQRRRGGP